MAKAPYKTKQMTEILTFLKSVQGRHVTVNESAIFREKGFPSEPRPFTVIWRRW